MKKARTLLPVLLTFMLAVSVCVSAGILLAPDAEAITTQTAGNYYIKVEVHDETSTFSQYDSCNNSAGYVVVPTVKQDGTEGPLWYATVKKGEWDSDNMTATYYYHADGKNKDASTNVAVAGFPAGLRKVQTASATATNWIKNNNGSWTSRERFRVYVSADNSNWTCVLDYYENTSSGGNWSYTNAVESSEYPALNAVAITGPTTVLTHGSAKQTYTVTAACDQYGVNWGFSSVSWASSNSNATITGGGVATFGFNGGAAYATVFTPSLYNGSYSSVNTVAVSVNPVADTIALHETKTAAINAGNGHFFCFKPTTTGNYAFWAGGTDLDPLGIVFDAGCNELIRQDDISSSSNGNPTAQSVLGLSSGNRHYVVYKFTSNTEYFLFTNDYYNVNSGNTKTGSYPVTVSRAVDLTFNDANSGATTTFTGMPSNQPFVVADRVSYTRDGHTLLAWSESGTASEAKKFMHSDTLTIPTSNKTYYALWYPNSPATLTANNDYTAAVDAGAQIRFYQFTPSSTRKYLIYGKSGTDTYVNLYNAAAYQSSAAILASQDDSGTDDGTMYGYAFDGLTYNQFFLLQQLTANTRYLYGVKFYNSSATGDLPFRFEEVYSVTYDLRGGEGTFEDQDKFFDKELTLSADEPTRTGYSFKGWSTDPAGNTVDYAPGATYTGNADLALYAVWAADPAFLNWAYTMGKSTYDNGGSGISGLGDAVANGKTILDSVNAYSDTYDQTQADAAANAILAALPEATLNSGVTVDIATPGEGYCQRFTPSASGTYIFYSYATERAGDPYGFIYSGAGAELAKQDDISSSSNGAPAMQALLGIQNNQHYVTYNMTAGTAYYLYTRCYSTSDTGTYPVMISSPVKLTFDPAGGSETVVKENVPGGAPLPLTNIAPTRGGHSLLAWSESGEADEPKAYMANGTLTVPSSDKTYYALWYPDDPAEVSLNTDHTASVTAASQIVYYSFTPSVTSRYVLYSKGVDVSVIDPAVLLYDANAYAADASYLVFDDDGGNNHHDFVGSSNRNFFVETELTAGTAYLIGVKNYRRTLGDIPFRIERVYSVTYDANNGDGAPDAQSKYYGKDLTLSSAEPTRDGYSFKGWATGSTATAAEYAAGGSYTADADAVLYAVWEINSYTVTFKDGYTGATLTTASVEHGSAAIAPTPADYHAIDGNNEKHMKFTGWDGSFSSVTGALTVTAQYAQEDHDYGAFASVDGNDHSRTCADCGFVDTGAHAWEWITDTAATCGAAGVKHQKCSICDAEQNENTPIDPTGEHTAGEAEETVITPATCGESGSKRVVVKCSVCGATLSDTTEEIPATGNHTPDEAEESVITPATCGAAGSKRVVVKCSVCGTTLSDTTAEIPATGAHTAGAAEESVITPATCGAAGSKRVVVKCSVCGATLSDTTAEIPATGEHSWKWVVDTEPTCGAAGVKHEECENCDAVQSENTPIDPTGEHSWKWVTDTEPTCGVAGVKHEECENCDAVRNENTPIDATGAHVWKWVTDTEPTCGAAGVKHEECENCDAVQNENTEIPATGAHIWKWVTDTEPTCGAAGVKHEECENCDAVQSENTPIDPTGAHVWKWVTDTEPTCGAAGVKHEECENCDAVQSENTPIDATGAHTAGEAQETVITPATCGAAGSKRVVVKCSVCGTTLSDTTEEIPATGAHVWKWVVDTEPTCGAAGVKHEECENCGAVQNENTEIPATGEHTPGEAEESVITPATCGESGSKRVVVKCSVCGTTLSDTTAEIPATGEHVWKWVTDTEATCGAAGVKHEECENCDATQSAGTEIPATGEHTPGASEESVITPATCGAAGSKRVFVKCSVCGTTLSDTTEEIPATGEHTPGAAEESVITPATCGAAGSKREVVKCSVCGTTLSDTTAEIPATGAHTAGAAEESVITPATCGAAGSKRVVVKCSVCGTTLSDTTAEIPATGEHTPGAAEESVITPATCGAAGSKRVVVKCSVCGTTLSDTTAEIPATGEHTPGAAEESVITPATCGESGSKRVVVKCSVCGTTLSDTTAEIPATGEHSWKWVTDTEPTCGAAGVKHEECENCDATQSEGTEIPATGVHDLVCASNGDGTHAVTCRNCDYSATSDCDYEETFHAATCVKGSYTTYVCKECGYTFDGAEGDDRADHDLVYASNGDGTHAVSCRNCDYSATADCDYAETAHAATCVKGAYTTYVCKDCGYSYDGEPTGEPDASNHAGAITTVGAQAATATEDGYTGDKVCSACGETVETGTVIPATGEEPTHPANPSGGERIHGRFCFCYDIPTRTTIGLMIHYLCEIICAVLEFIFGLNIWA